MSRYKHKIAIFFTILFMAMMSVPSIIVSIDNDVDISSFYGIAEEEESENMKLLYEYTTHTSEPDFVAYETIKLIEYRCATYPKPHLNLISPPPDANLS